jgi:hypothetical protein
MYDTPLGTRRLSVGQPDEVRAGHGDAHVRPVIQAPHLPAVMLRRDDELPRDHALAEDASVGVHVLKEQVERQQPLRQPAADVIPFVVRQDPGQQVIGEDPLGSTFVPVDGEGDALLQEGRVRLPLPPPQVVRRQVEQPRKQGPIGRPRLPVALEHLVEVVAQRVAGKHGGKSRRTVRHGRHA